MFVFGSDAIYMGQVEKLSLIIFTSSNIHNGPMINIH